MVVSAGDRANKFRKKFNIIHNKQNILGEFKMIIVYGGILYMEMFLLHEEI